MSTCNVIIVALLFKRSSCARVVCVHVCVCVCVCVCVLIICVSFTIKHPLCFTIHGSRGQFERGWSSAPFV